MSISIDVVSHAMRTILGFLNKPPSQAAAFVQSVHKMCGWMKPDRFEKVCDKVAEDLSPGRLPTYKQFIAVYRQLEDTLNWKAHDFKEKKECAVCHGSGWVRVKLYNPNLGEKGVVDLFNKPCERCRSDHPHHNLPLTKGWVETEEPLTWPMDLAPRPATARFLSQLYEEIPADDPVAAIEMFNYQRREKILRPKKLQNGNVFGGFIHALETKVARPDTGAAGGAQEAVPRNVEAAILPAEDGGQLPPF